MPTTPVRLLTVSYIADLLRESERTIERVLSQNPGIQPRAIADNRLVFDQRALLSITAILDQEAAREGRADAQS